MEMRSVRLGAFPSFIFLFAIMYAAFGVASPFWPRFFEWRGLTPEQLGLLLGIGTVVRLVAGPVVGRVADMFGALRAALAELRAIATAEPIPPDAPVTSAVIPVRSNIAIPYFWFTRRPKRYFPANVGPNPSLQVLPRRREPRTKAG